MRLAWIVYRDSEYPDDCELVFEESRAYGWKVIRIAYMEIIE